MADYKNEENKAKEKNLGQFAEKAIEKAEKAEKIKKWVTRIIVATKIIGIGMVIGGIFALTTFLAGAIDYNDWDTYTKGISAKSKAIGEDAYGKIITLEDGKYKIEYDGKTGKEAIQSLLEENDMNFEDFTEEEIECLYKCLKAEWATTYPNLGQTVDNTDINSENLQGVITIKRGKQDGTVIGLTYKPYEEFKNIKDETALNYFSIEDGNLIVANWSSSQIIYTPSESMPADIKNQYVNEGEQISITETSIDYKGMIGIHTVPFEFLLALLVNTEDVDFVNELAEVALNSTLEITVYDNVTETIAIETEHVYEKTTYKKWVEYQTYTTTQKYDKDGISMGGTSTFGERDIYEFDSAEYDETDYTLTTKIITKSNSYVLGLTNVSSWLSDIKNEYTYVTNIGEEVDLGLGEPYEYTQDKPVEEISTSDSEVVAFKNSKTSGPITTKDEEEDTTTVTTKGCNILAARRQGTLKGKQEITKNTNQQNEYKYESSTKQTSNIGTKFKGVYDNNKKAQAQLDSVASWLFELLEETEAGVDYVSIMKYLLYICTGEDYGISEEEINGLLEYSSTISYQSAGNLSAFGCTITREQFIDLTKAHKTSDSTYQSKMAAYAGDFYDVCTKYNVNPVIAYAHACLETGYGSSIPYNNYFGMAVYNGASSGSTYNSPKESIEDYCKWIVNNATIGTSAYAANVSRAEEWGKENEKLLGTPDNNIYALYCRYAYLGDKHLCDDNMDSPKGTDYYSANGSNWGSGGRIYIYEMYEKGGLYTGQYKTLCGHENANDPTTIKERADYVEYTTNKRINIAKDIFGESILSSNGNISSSNVSGEILEIAEDTFNVIVKTGGKPYNQSTSHNVSWPYTSSTIDCSSYLGVVLYRLGYTDFGGAQKNSSWWYYNSDATIKKYGWQSFYITGPDDINKLQPGDILAYNGSVTGNYAGYNFSGSTRNHVQIVQSVNGNKVYAWDCGYYPVTKREGPDKSNNIYFWGFHGKKGVKVIRIIDKVESVGTPSGKGEQIANFAQQFIGKNGSYICGTEIKNVGWSYAGEWCAVFASYCYKRMGVNIPGDSVPETYVSGMYNYAVANGKWKARGSYTPKAGDLIIYDWDGGDNNTNHVGIVTGSDGQYVYTVEGNTGSYYGWQNRIVDTKKYSLTAYFIRGYYSL